MPEEPKRRKEKEKRCNRRSRENRGLRIEVVQVFSVLCLS
jgi:hypothetical protein